MAIRFGTQFTGSVPGNSTRTWFTHSWNAAHNVVWNCIPTAPAIDGPAQLEWTVRATRQAPNLVKWFISARNVGAVPVNFQARYAILNG